MVWYGIAALLGAAGSGLTLQAQEQAAPSLAEKIEAIAAASPAATRGHWGAMFVDAGSGEVLYARQENSFFVPASNTKLYSTALALMRLGPEHRQVTRLVAARGLTAAGVLRGDLRFIGAGDATMSARVFPYDAKSTAASAPPLRALDELAEQAWQNGLRRVEGDVVGDDTRYVWEPFPDGWAQDDTKLGYGAPVSALLLHDNTVTVRIEGAAEAGQAPRVTVSPTPAYWTVVSRLRTVGAHAPAQRVRLEREPGSRQIELWGAVRVGAARELSLAVDDPAHYAAFALREALERRGIAVAGDTAARHRHPLMSDGAAPPRPVPGVEVELARRASPPLIETLRVIGKESQNLHAETVLVEVAHARGREPGRAGALAELREFLTEAGVDPADTNFEDGSGLSRLTLVTPAATVRLLRFMDASSYRGEFRSLLPLGGVDGSLEKRFPRLPAAARVLAKTGTLSHTAALAGYIERPAPAAPVIFCVMVNNSNSPGSAQRAFIDKIVTTVMEE
ncbi:MAG: D-alanyl-D-alanine carboxypeptidase/D-alanyl-D-alanine-endopeptidase [Bryobacterales bacterium]|nr:D-alanyl-D-alanine carboxypeptidase/D-alanyl-D-alanine-endopeptidase [Bryobacterales bacterium]